jgi:hypothetical protein
MDYMEDLIMAEKKVSVTRVKVNEKVLGLLKDEFIQEWNKKYGITNTYSEKIIRTTQATYDYDKARAAAIKKISEQVEDYAIATFKEYGVKKIPVCKRSDVATGNLDIQIRVEKFPEKEIEKLRLAVDREDEAMMKDREAINTWYSQALEAVIHGEEVPERPKIK